MLRSVRSWFRRLRDRFRDARSRRRARRLLASLGVVRVGDDEPPTERRFDRRAERRTLAA